MIENYGIVVINGEERLILFLNLHYEFGGKKNNTWGLKQEIIEYIKKNRINFHGGIIMLVVGGVLMGNVIFNNDEFSNYQPSRNYNYVSDMIIQKLDYNISNSNNEEAKDVLKHKEVKKDNIISKDNSNSKKDTTPNKTNASNITSKGENDIKFQNNEEENRQKEAFEEVVEDNNFYVNVKKKDGNILKIELEEYVIGVVGAEMPALFNIEALKSQAIIARTYAIKNTLKGNILKDNESNQTYKTNNELKDMWGSNYNSYYNKIKRAVNETEGMGLTYNGSYIEAVYHSTSNGITESSVNVWGNYYPYLVSVDSKYDSLNVSFEVKKEIPYQELSNKLGIDINKETIVELNGRTSGNRIESIKIDDHVYKGIDFRNIMGLRSADFDIEKTDNGIMFTTRGYGHGVGLSQYGANGMAKNGYNYEQILKHYYPGVNLSKKV